MTDGVVRSANQPGRGRLRIIAFVRIFRITSPTAFAVPFAATPRRNVRQLLQRGYGVIESTIEERRGQLHDFSKPNNPRQGTATASLSSARTLPSAGEIWPAVEPVKARRVPPPAGQVVGRRYEGRSIRLAGGRPSYASRPTFSPGQTCGGLPGLSLVARSMTGAERIDETLGVQHSRKANGATPRRARALESPEPPTGSTDPGGSLELDPLVHRGDRRVGTSRPQGRPSPQSEKEAASHAVGEVAREVPTVPVFGEKAVPVADWTRPGVAADHAALALRAKGPIVRQEHLSEHLAEPAVNSRWFASRLKFRRPGSGGTVVRDAGISHGRSLPSQKTVFACLDQRRDKAYSHATGMSPVTDPMDRFMIRSTRRASAVWSARSGSSMRTSSCTKATTWYPALTRSQSVNLAPSAASPWNGVFRAWVKLTRPRTLPVSVVTPGEKSLLAKDSLPRRPESMGASSASRFSVDFPTDGGRRVNGFMRLFRTRRVSCIPARNGAGSG